MTRGEAEKIIAEMKLGMGFSDEENDVFWSYTYDSEKNVFCFLDAWMVIGAPLSSTEYSEAEFLELLIKDFDYQAVLSCAFSRGIKSPAAGNPVPDTNSRNYKEKVVKAITEGDLSALKEVLPAQGKFIEFETTEKHRTPLTLACEYSHPEIVEYLIGRGADVNRADGRKETPMELACNGYKKENLGKIVKLLLDAGAKIPKHKSGEDGPIHHAAMYGSTEAVKLLVKHGVGVDIPGSYGRTPLLYAAADGKSAEMIDFLVQAGAKVNSVNEGKDNALFEVVTRDDPSVEAAEKLIDAGLDIGYVHPNYGTILCWAANCGRKEIVELLIKRGADVNAQNKRNESPIAQAMMGSHHDIVKLLFAAGADATSKNYGGWSLLEYATEQKDQDFVKAIIDRSKNKKSSQKDNDEERDHKSEALMKAAEKGDIAMLSLLIDQGAPIDGLSRCGNETPLMKAAYYGQKAAAARLLDHGASIEARDSRGNTALNHAAWTGKEKVVELLVQRGADVNAVNDLNWNSLMQAALEGHVSSAKILLEKGARTDFIDKEKGASALYLAERSGSKELVALLKKHGAVPREFRKRASNEPYLAITDCEYCQYIPQRKDLARDESLGDYPGLVELHTETTEVDRYAANTVDILQCKLCGTFYQNDYYIDTEDDFVAGPTIYRHLQRFNFERLKMALAEHTLEKEAADFAARLPQLIAGMKEILASEGSAIHSRFLPHFIENVTDTYLVAGDWPGLKKDLLLHADKKVALQVADDLIIIFGEGKYASSGTEQVYKAYRHITPGLFNCTRKLLAAYRKEFRDILKNIQALPGHKAAAKKVIESAKYYKV